MAQFPAKSIFVEKNAHTHTHTQIVTGDKLTTKKESICKSGTQNTDGSNIFDTDKCTSRCIRCMD